MVGKYLYVLKKYARRLLTSSKFIVITVVIGSGCFTDFGVAARTAGPVGLILAVLILGVVAVCAMEGLSEMTQIFPTVNPLVELVHHFVDADLALCVGISYWYDLRSQTLPSG